MASSLTIQREGAGEPLLLIHGIGSSRRCWAPVFGTLAARHEVIAIDLPGFGESPRLALGVPRTVPSLVDAVERALDELGLNQVHVAGNSMGGWLALELARRGRALDVVAISPAGLGTASENRRSRGTLLSLRAIARGLAPVAGPVCRPVISRTLVYGLLGTRPWRLDAEEAAYAVRVLAGARGFRATLDWLFSHNATGLGEIDVPVTVLWGTRDAILSPRQGPRFRDAIPGCKLRTLPGLGHIPMSDDPDLIASSILAVTAGATGQATTERTITGAIS
jgi:pimeloyl-ACP methyl ester carboxylesterase